MSIQAVSQMTRETATMAFCLPRLRAIRWYIAPRRVSVLTAVIAACPRAPRRYRFPLPVRPGFAVSPDCWLPGGQPCPSGGVPGRGELGGAGAELGDEGPAVDGADAGDLLQPGGQVQDGYVLAGAAGGVAAAGQPARDKGRCGAGNQCQLLSDLLVQGGDLGADRVGQPQVHRDLEGVDVTEPPGQGLCELGAGGLEPLVPQRRQRGRGAFPGDQGIEEPAAAGTEQVRDHHRD